MNDRRLRNEFRELQMSYANVVDANVFLVDENKLLKQDVERLNNIINELEKYIGAEWYCFDNESVEFEVAKDILDKLQELKGSDKE